jgi:predicted RNA-binding Zn ribbon-like protein
MEGVTSRQPAPGSLALVEAFLRTRNEVSDPATLDRWQRAHGLRGRDGMDTGKDYYERVVRLREALRELMFTNNGGPSAPAAAEIVNAELRACDLHPVIGPDGLTWPTGDGLLPAVLAGVLTAMTDGTWQRMKACAADDCRYAFYDHTRNRSGRWCDVSGCGANSRMRAYRLRKAGEGGDQ